MLALTQELVTSEAEAFAEKLGDRGPDTDTQIRKYYDDFLLLEKKARRGGVDFEKEILPLVQFEKAKFAYAVSRKVLTDGFYKSLVRYIDRIESKEDLDNFLLFYEALIAYTKYNRAVHGTDNQQKNDGKKQGRGKR